MSTKTLFIEAFQPFAQYRNPFTFYYAQTFPLPPKSTIVGMLQNATGEATGKYVKYYRNEFWDLKVSVHGGFESIFWNYQQLIKGEITIGRIGLLNKHDRNPLGKIWHPLYYSNIKAQRTPVYQQELFNGHLFIFIRGNEDLIYEIKSALESPKKILYLGRSEDVIFLRDIKILEDEGISPELKPVKRNIWLTFPTYIKLYHNGKEFPIENKKFPVYSIPVWVEFRNNGKPIKNKAELRKDTERKVKFETIIYTGFDYVVYLKEKIEVEIFRLDNKKIFNIPENFGWL